MDMPFLLLPLFRTAYTAILAFPAALGVSAIFCSTGSAPS